MSSSIESRRVWFLATVALLAVTASAAPRIASAEDDAATARARRTFEVGLLHMKEARYQAAYRAFREAYATAPRWQILQPFGVACLHLERYGEAIEALEKFLAEGGDKVDPDLREQTERDIAMLRPSLVQVVLSFDRDGIMLMDERLEGSGDEVAMTNRYESVPGTLTLGVRAGRHRMTATSAAEPGKTLIWEFDSQQPHVTLSHRFVFEALTSPPPAAPPPEPGSPRPEPDEKTGPSPGFYIAAAGTGALLIASSTTGILALSAKSRFDEQNDRRHVDDASSLKDDGERLVLVTDILIGATVLAAGGTAYLYFKDRRRTEQPAPVAAKRATWFVSPVVGLDGAGLRLRGRF